MRLCRAPSRAWRDRSSAHGNNLNALRNNEHGRQKPCNDRVCSLPKLRSYPNRPLLKLIYLSLPVGNWSLIAIVAIRKLRFDGHRFMRS